MYIAVVPPDCGSALSVSRIASRPAVTGAQFTEADGGGRRGNDEDRLLLTQDV